MNCMKTWPFIAFNVMSSVWRDDSHISPGVLLICALCRRLWEGFNFLIALTTFSIWPTVLCCSLSRSSSLPFTLPFRSNSCKLPKSQTKTATTKKRRKEINGQQQQKPQTQIQRVPEKEGERKRKKKCCKQIKDQHVKRCHPTLRHKLHCSTTKLASIAIINKYIYAHL